MAQQSKATLALRSIVIAAHEGPHAFSSWRLESWKNVQDCLVRLKTRLPEGDCWKMSARITWDCDLEYDFQFELPSAPFNLLSEIRTELERLAGRSCPPGMDEATYKVASRTQLQPFFEKLLDTCDWGPDHARREWAFLIDLDSQRPVMEGDPDLLMVKDKILKEAASHPEIQSVLRTLGLPQAEPQTALLSGWFLPEEIQEIRECPDKAMEHLRRMNGSIAFQTSQMPPMGS